VFGWSARARCRAGLSSWLPESGCAPGRAVRVLRAFARFSAWMAGCWLSAADLDEDVVDKYIRAEQQRSGSRSPAAFQYLPLARRFLAQQGVLVLRGPAGRDRGGLPRSAGGPLTAVIVDLVAWLRAQGYARGTSQSVACTAARLGVWMGQARLGVRELDDGVLTRFVASELHGSSPHPSSARRIVTVRKFLVAAGLFAVAQVSPPVVTPVTESLERWGRYVRDGHGAGPSWVREQHGWARGFLERISGGHGQIRWQDVEVHVVNEYIADRGRGYSLASRRHLVSAMRSLLRWAFATGLVERQMAPGVLGPPGRALAGPPQSLTPGQVEAIKAAADVTTAIGLRDYALVVMISRLGLRAGEVAGLSLDGIDWHHGQVCVHGKGAITGTRLAATGGRR